MRPGAVAIIVGFATGLFAGTGTFTFFYARGTSYITNDPKVCANCHIMQGHLDSWAKSPHHHVAVCNDCHTPHDFVGKYFTKGRNGMYHSLAFTSGRFPEPIMITDFNRRIAERSCRSCHADMVQMIDCQAEPGRTLDCLRCHGDVGHE